MKPAQDIAVTSQNDDENLDLTMRSLYDATSYLRKSIVNAKKWEFPRSVEPTEEHVPREKEPDDTSPAIHLIKSSNNRDLTEIPDSVTLLKECGMPTKRTPNYPTYTNFSSMKDNLDFKEIKSWVSAKTLRAAAEDDNSVSPQLNFIELAAGLVPALEWRYVVCVFRCNLHSRALNEYYLNFIECTAEESDEVDTVESYFPGKGEQFSSDHDSGSERDANECFNEVVNENTSCAASTSQPTTIGLSSLPIACASSAQCTMKMKAVLALPKYERQFSEPVIQESENVSQSIELLIDNVTVKEHVRLASHMRQLTELELKTQNLPTEVSEVMLEPHEELLDKYSVLVPYSVLSVETRNKFWVTNTANFEVTLFKNTNLGSYLHDYVTQESRSEVNPEAMTVFQAN
ncbi:hypothetical protein PR048_020958 [Dryococelus australis]|uniref:Uncharacterized protein n=1 Tax=Dryococelus australis TaxID=614101 RepID=A0ABQ9GWV6_9NEOP|nr:hypothetical protein PR048_020958 [Dryococelus australis]